MFYKGSYDYINSSIMLKRLKPRKGIVPQGPDLSHFLTGDDQLALLANFGLEMRKFLPDFEQMVYSGDMIAKEGEGQLIEHGIMKDERGNILRNPDGTPRKYETWVTNEWWQALNEYGLTTEEARAYAALAGLSDFDDRDEDGRITNADTIVWADDPEGFDGFGDFRGDELDNDNTQERDLSESKQKRWIAGQHHRTGRFTPFGSEADVGMAGASLLKGFKNVKKTVDAADWSHITTKSGASASPEVAEQSYFLQSSAYNPDFNFLTAIGSSWEEVTALFESGGPLAGKSFYQIVMDRSYTELSQKQATLLIAAMYESRERGWACMAEVFGDITESRSDADMIASIDGFFSEHNAYNDHHALSLFPLFLYMQHSYTNQLTMFYEKGNNQGYNASVLDEERFYEFSCWAGTRAYQGADDADEQTNILYQYRDTLGARYGEDSAQYRAVIDLIDRWFGAANVENGRPIYEKYGDRTDGGRWVDIDDYTLTARSARGAARGTVVSWVWQPEVTDASYGWDRKWSNSNLYYSTDRPADLSARGDATYLQPNNNGPSTAGLMVHDWTMVHQRLYGDQSKLNPLFYGAVHPNYIASQFAGLSYTQVVSGPVFASNWAVHAVGMFLKWGEGLDIVSIAERAAKKRETRAVYKARKTDYDERMQEVLDEEALEEKLAIKAIMQARVERQKDEQKATQRQKSNDAKMGSREYEQSMQKLRQRLLRASGKHKAWLKKTKNDTK